MSISYSGLTNYGKVTLPSVESWNGSANIIKDPPRSVMTRRIDKVGDTSELLATLAASDDRFCEAINYYARGINPMVSVSYGEGQTQMNTSSNGQAFLPYRVVRDGAFRPPIWMPEDLLPLSRMPRNWTTVDPRPFEVDYTKRLFDCGTAETTQQVKTNLMKKQCETQKTIAAYPTLTAPQPKYMLKDPLAPGTDTNKSCPQNEVIVFDRKPKVLAETRPFTQCRTNLAAYKDKQHPIDVATVDLKSNRPAAECSTNFRTMKEIPIDIAEYKFETNHPTTLAFTNLSGAVYGVDTNTTAITDAEYDRMLPSRKLRGSFECKPSIPSFVEDHGLVKLTKVR